MNARRSTNCSAWLGGFALALFFACASIATARPDPAGAMQPAPSTQPLSAVQRRVLADNALLEHRLVSEGVNAVDRVATGSNADPTQTDPVVPKQSSLDFTRIASALAIVIGLIVGARVLFKHFFAGASAPATSKAVKVIGRTSIAPRQQILLIQIGGRVVVVSEANGGMTTLAQIEDPDEVARLVGQLQDEQINRGASFGGLFGRMQKKYDEEETAQPLTAAEPTAEGSAMARTQAAALEEEQQLNQAKSELSGLVDKVRSLRSQMGQ